MTIPTELMNLSKNSISALQRLINYQTPPDLFPMKRRAAVMVGLFASRNGHLNVLLTKRSQTMRTYAGQTALPGGKMEIGDLDLEHTARREAYEECGLTRNPKKVRKLTIRGSLIVTPVVCFITDQTLMPRLNSKEVDVLFSHRLEQFLGHQDLSEPVVSPETISPIKKPSERSSLPTSSIMEHPYMRSYENHWFSQRIPFRYFEFESKISPIVGFTANVLIETAQIAYGREPNFERYAKGQWKMKDLIKFALKESDEFRVEDQVKKGQVDDLGKERKDAQEEEMMIDLRSNLKSNLSQSFEDLYKKLSQMYHRPKL
ncbi:NUDIX hydrolase domain-like protein [Melampsora americana]|nr:NUDIX hydrolase domain-like protein [Melampsora americana]